MNVICTKNLMNVLIYTNVQSESANEVQSMCQDTMLEAKVPEIAPKAMKQPLLSSDAREHTKPEEASKLITKRCQRPHFTTQNSL